MTGNHLVLTTWLELAGLDSIVHRASQYQVLSTDLLEQFCGISDSAEFFAKSPEY